MAYERLDLQYGDPLDADVFKHIEDGIEALDLVLDSKLVEVEKTHISTNRFDKNKINFEPVFYVGNNIDANKKFAWRNNVATSGGGGWLNIPVESGKTYTMSVQTITLEDLNLVYGNIQNIFFTDLQDRVITVVSYDAKNFYIKVTGSTETSIVNEVAYDANKITCRAYSGTNSYRGMQTNSVQFTVIDENIAQMHVMVGCNDFWKYQIEKSTDFVNRGRLTSEEISILQNSFQINEGISLLPYEEGGDYKYTVTETQSNLTKLQSAFSQKEIPSDNLLNPAYARNAVYTMGNSKDEDGKPKFQSIYYAASLVIPVQVGSYILHQKENVVIGDRTFIGFARCYFTDKDGYYITGNYPFQSHLGFEVGIDGTKAMLSGDMTNTVSFTVIDENIKYIVVPIMDSNKDTYGRWTQNEGKVGITNEELQELVYSMQLNAGKKVLDWRGYDDVTYKTTILPENVDGLDTFQADMVEKINEALSSASAASNNMVVYCEDENIFVKSKKYSDDSHFIWKLRQTRGGNEDYNSNLMFNLETAYTCSSNCMDEDFASLTNFKGLSDDLCPVNFDGTYIGANHGYNCLDRVTTGSHDKTIVDIGSIWTCNNKKYVLVRIVDATTLDFVMFNDTNMSTGIFGYGNPSGTMTHVSGATNTSNVTVTSNSATQLRRGINNYSIKMLIDGKEQEFTNGVYSGNSVEILTQYNTIYVPATLQYLMDNVGNNTNESLYSDDITDSYLTLYVDYKFNINGSISTYSSFYINKDMSLGYFGLVQSGSISNTSVLYIPDTVYDTPTVQNATTFSFKPETWRKSDKVPYRYYQYSDDTLNKGIAMIYDRSIGYGDNTKRLTQITHAGQFYTTEKMYPALISGGTLKAGRFIDGMAVRVPLYKHDPDFTAMGWYWVNDDIILMFDTHKSINKDVMLPDYMNNMRIEVLDKTDSVTMEQTYIFNVKLRFQCTDYGYAVLRLYK